MTVPWWAWAAFLAFVAAVVALDMFVLHRRDEVVTLRQAGLWTAVWVAFGLGFGGVLLAWQGGPTAEAYLAGYLIEKSLSVDNIFVFAIVFSAFATPARYQHRVLMYGIVGALVMRGAFIFGGAALLDTLHAALYLFGAVLLYTSYNVFHHGDTTLNPGQNPVLRAFRRVLPTTDTLDGPRFVTRRHGRWAATPLLAVLIAVETTDVVFALDSIPAVFGVTRDTFVVFTSNAFALLGMRALYFLIAGAARRFRYLQPALGAILATVH